MRESERKVGRADNNPAGGREASRNTGDPSIVESDSADARAHGTHGRGRGEEKRDDRPPAQADAADGSDSRGSAGWGSEASGGSVIDKRSEHD